jgi:hypothetical protein
MRVKAIFCAALAVAMLPAAAFADNANDPTMRSSAARERDRQITRQLNNGALASARERNARDAAGWKAYRNHDARAQDYARDRAQYERDMAAWRRAVAACRSGNHAACAR